MKEKGGQMSEKELALTMQELWSRAREKVMPLLGPWARREWADEVREKMELGPLEEYGLKLWEETGETMRMGEECSGEWLKELLKGKRRKELAGWKLGKGKGQWSGWAA